MKKSYLYRKDATLSKMETVVNRRTIIKIVKDSIMNNTTDNVPELKSPFEQLREVDAEGREWWNSRKLARVMGYGKYWNFERVMEKAMAWTTQKGYTIAEHFREISEMAELGSGAVREVTSVMQVEWDEIISVSQVKDV